ncbi:30S ribosomal protein S8 [Candidatus Woesearchaeota archaeon]|nr:30S ribosomal protein S8 [Candidatus Woesearchaeota archaeon]|tara:strand:+ start:16814 stop:17203 length:390 start_codon:yes stop_codon:yes gene_type:complete
MMNDPLANALSLIVNAELRGKTNCTITPVSNLIKKILTIMNKDNYIGKFTETETSAGIVLKVELLGAINKCGAVKPRFTVKNNEFEKFEKKFLPAKDFGFIVVSTSQGIMTHIEAKQKSLGGKLIAYFY